MRIKKNLLKRLKIAIQFIFINKNARIMTCGSCGKTDLIPISNSLEIPFMNEDIKADEMCIQFTRCRSCGAVCKEIQLWNNSGNVNELDKAVNKDE
jgi:C4-type Zn-finger protein